MIVTKILGNINDFPLQNRTVDKLFVEWYELDKKLLRKTSEAGEEVGIRLSEDEGFHGHFHEGDVLYADDTKVTIVDILPCELTVTEVSSMKEMGRLCFELGNRHLSLAIEEGKVSVPYDEPTFLYLKKLGFAAEKRTEKFTHFTVCHGHEHTHGEGGHTHGEGGHTHGEGSHTHGESSHTHG